MTANGWLQIAIFFLLILACAKPLGSFIATIIEGRKNFQTPLLGPVERIDDRRLNLLFANLGARGLSASSHQ